MNGVSAGSDFTAPHQFAIGTLGNGMKSIDSVATSTFGERIKSATSQVFVTGFVDTATAPAWGTGTQRFYRVDW